MAEAARKISSEENKTVGLLKEHEHLTELLSQIPQKVQRGLKTQPEVLELTSIDANQQFIALGSNIGTIFLYDRDKHTIIRLRSENTHDSIVCVSLHHGLDDMVAAGYTTGAIYIFQLPSLKMGHSKKLEKIVVPDLHEHPIQCLTWSTNGMKLYSGDNMGSVGCTEVDFYEGKCTSSMLLIESTTEIVQLSAGHRSLLVSTKHRCLVCRMDDHNRIVQVGSKDRKILGNFGACFIPALCKTDDAQLFASRPGYRIWKASIRGTVNNTFIFKDILSGTHTEIPALPFETTDIIKSEGFNQFGPIHLMYNKYVVTWNAGCLYVVDPDSTVLIGSQKRVGHIRSVVVTENEIFVLRMGTDRHVIRISDKPLPSSASQVLRLLQEERKDKDKHTVEEDKEPSTAKDISPFKALQGNILDRVKKIPKPSVIAEKIQDKLKLDNKSEPSKYESQAYVFNDDKDQTKGSNQDSPPRDLPPVIELDSPELLKLNIEVDKVIDGQAEYKSLDIHDISHVEGFTELSGGRSLETELTDDQSGNLRKTGTGAFSALARLQEDHKQDEKAEPVYRINSVELDKSVRDPFSFVTKEDTGDDIVFSKKIKGKTKKKKKGTKDQKPKTNQLMADKDQDSISVHSTNSILSDISDSVSHSGTHDNIDSVSHSGTHDNIDSVSHSGTHDNIDSVSHSGTHGVSDSVSHSGTHDNIDSVSHSGTHGVSDTVSHSGNHDNQIETEGILDKSDTSEPVAIPDLKPQSSNDTRSDEVINDNDVTETEMPGESDGTDQLDDIKPEIPDEVRKAEDMKALSDLEHEKKPLDHTQPSHSIPSESGPVAVHSSLTGEEEPNVSNLDQEILRLNSFLSGSSDLERSNSSSDTITQSSDYSQGQYHHILLKETQNGHKIPLNNSLLTSDREYVPSSLEQEILELENKTIGTQNKGISEHSETRVPADTPSLGSLDLQSPSIYSMYKTPSTSGEDFYSKYGLTSPDISLDTADPHSHQTEAMSRPHATNIVGNVLTEENEGETNEDQLGSSVKVSEVPSTPKSVNNWTEFNAPGNINSLCVSHSHVWITDRSYNIYYSQLRELGISWKRVAGYAAQISVSKNGNIVWRLYKNVVYAGTKITSKHPEGMKWVEAVKDVAYICVAETCAWYIKTSFEVMVQKGLSKDRPCYTAQSVDCSQRLKQIVCQSGVVWALTDKCQWLYRDGVTASCPEGTSWKSGDSGSEKTLFSYLSLGEGDLGWAVDVVGQIWFCCDVTMATPRGDGRWWQVPLSGDYIMKDMSAYDLLKSVTKKFDPIKLTMLLSTQSGGLVCGRDGVWVCPEYKHTLHVCYGSLQGHLWSEAHPESMASSSVWKIVLARNASAGGGIIWGQQPNGDLFCFSPNRDTCTSVETPTGSVFVCMSVCPDALWGLTANGSVYIRTGVSANQMQGVGWCRLDLSQLDESHLVSVTCGKLNVWAVDSDGNVFHRIGVRAPTDHSLNAAWLPVDNGGTQFTKIIAGSQDWMVWAIDNKRQVYVRKGITLEMPIGKEWVHVSGSPAMSITLSDQYVWAINHSGELLCRHGVSMENVTGDYWKIVPGNFGFITVSPDDVLWGINKEGQLLRRYTKYVINNAQEFKTQSRKSVREASLCSEDGEWEFV